MPAPYKVDTKTAVESDDEKLLSQWKAQFHQAYSWQKRWRDEKKTWEHFYDGEQLSEEEKQTLKERGQPEVVINRVKSVMDGIFGLQMGSKTIIKAFPRGADFDLAKFVSEGIRWIEDHTDFESQQDDVFEDMGIVGRGWYRHQVVFEGVEPEFRTERVDYDDVYPDPYGKREDLLDHKYIDESAWFDLEDAKEMFPDSGDLLESSIVKPSAGLGDFIATEKAESEHRPDQYRADGGETGAPYWCDYDRKRVRIVGHFYRIAKRKRFASHPNLGTQDVTDISKRDLAKLKKAFPEVELFSNLTYQLNYGAYVWNGILEHKKDIRSWDSDAKYPFVKADAFVTRDERRMPYGMVKQIVDPQKELNKRRSKMLHLINVAQIIAEQGAVEDIEQAKRELAKPDGAVLYNPDRKFDVQRGAQLYEPHFMMYQEAKKEIEETGVNREITGTPSDSNASGRKIQLRQSQVVQNLRRLFKNLRSAHRRCAQLWLEDMQHYKTGEWFVRLTDQPEAVAVLNAPVLGPNGQPVVDPKTGQVVREKNITIGKYDLKIEETEDTLNLQQETFQTLAQLAGTGKVPIPADMLVEASPLPNKKQLVERLKQEDALRAENAQLKQILAALQQQMQGGGGLPPGGQPQAALG
jgi:hypothetical protein